MDETLNIKVVGDEGQEIGRGTIYSSLGRFSIEIKMGTDYMRERVEEIFDTCEQIIEDHDETL
jgi:hypothetical protein